CWAGVGFSDEVERFRPDLSFSAPWPSLSLPPPWPSFSWPASLSFAAPNLLIFSKPKRLMLSVKERARLGEGKGMYQEENAELLGVCVCVCESEWHFAPQGLRFGGYPGRFLGGDVHDARQQARRAGRDARLRQGGWDLRAIGRLPARARSRPRL